LFREEFEQHVVDGRCPFEHEEKTLVGVRSGATTHEEHGGLGLGEAGIGTQPSAGIDVDREGGGEDAPGSRN
jgi:hypothetical protein